jgi:quercetin 2,3-dioxygenase
VAISGVAHKNHNFNTRNRTTTQQYIDMTLLSASTAGKLRRLEYLTTAFTASLLGSAAAFSSTATCSADGGNPVIKVIPNERLFVSQPSPQMFGNGPNPTSGSDASWTNKNWLKSRLHFSFAEYHNNDNTNFGVMRVMNDDLVQPKRGFGTHSHGNMEIITYIVHGELTHQDSLGTKETLGRGSIQFMTAGTGVRHSEYNHGNNPLRFIQTWIQPSKSGLSPKYGSFQAPEKGPTNEVVHLVSENAASTTGEHGAVSAPVQINQDVDVHAAELELGETVTMEIPAGRQAYLLCVEGKLDINGSELSKYDACEVFQGGTLKIMASDVEETERGNVAHFLMFTMKEVPGSGRKDI